MNLRIAVSIRSTKQCLHHLHRGASALLETNDAISFSFDDAAIRTSKLHVSSMSRLLQFSTLYVKKGHSAAQKDRQGTEAIKYALRKRGYYRRLALRKPQPNRIRRLEWAHEHLHWSREQWYSVLWTDETWIKSGKHRRTWVTRCAGEELDDTCAVDKVQRKCGWMFWGYSAGSTKGPYLFWEKDWGLINTASYQQHTVPIIGGWITMNPDLSLLQDNAPGHAAAETRQDLVDRGVRIIFWTAFGPDLNPIEKVWNRMKHYIKLHYPEKMSYDAL